MAQWPAPMGWYGFKCMTGLGATVEVAGVEGAVGEAGHCTASGDGGRWPSDECGRLVL